MRLPHLFLGLLCLLVATPAGAQDDTFRGGRFVARDDSLGFDEYRVLEPDDQLERRTKARRWVRRGNELDNPSLDPYATAVGYCPYLPEAWVRYAHNLNQLGRYRGATICLDHAARTMRFEPSDDRRADLEADAEGLRAAVAYNTGRFAEARDHIRVALTHREKEGAWRLLHARILVELGEFGEAAAILREFHDRDPDFAHALATLGNLEIQRGELVAADDAFDRAYKYGMRGAVFENDRGRLRLEQARPEDAVDHFESAIEQLPSFAEARNNLAVAYRRMGRPDRAVDVLEECVRRFPDYAAAHFNLAETYREQLPDASPAERTRLGTAALDAYDAALTHGYDPRAVVERRASLALIVEDLDLAEEDFLAITDDPDVDGRVIYLLGRVKKEQGEYEIAGNLFSMALQRGYDAADVHSDLGEVHLRTGDLENARIHLARAVEHNPELVVTRVNLSVVLSRLGELEEAERVLDEAAARDPDNELVRIQREALRQMRGGR